MRMVLASIHFPAHVQVVLADEQTTPEQIQIFRAMSPGQRLKLAERLYWSAWKLKLAGLRAQHPDWSEEQLKKETARIFLHART